MKVDSNFSATLDNVLVVNQLITFFWAMGMTLLKAWTTPGMRGKEQWIKHYDSMAIFYIFN